MKTTPQDLMRAAKEALGSARVRWNVARYDLRAAVHRKDLYKLNLTDVPGTIESAQTALLLATSAILRAARVCQCGRSDWPCDHYFEFVVMTGSCDCEHCSSCHPATPEQREALCVLRDAMEGR